ncbi:MAG: insulinase family protein [Bacilli bacterium]|nr:insulinase family protein [Bacilli bacterium]
MEYIIKDCDKYKIHFIKTNAFKSISFKINFIFPFKEEYQIIRNLFTEYMDEGTKNYNTLREMEKKKRDLYSAATRINSRRKGKLFSIEFDLTILEEQYTEENMINESIKFLKELVFNIDEKDGQVDSNKLQLCKKNMKKVFGDMKDSSSSYAHLRTMKLIDEKEYTKIGFFMQDKIDEISEKDIVDFHKMIINNSNIEIYAIGDFDNDQMENLIVENFDLKSKNSDYSNLKFINHEEEIILKDIVEDYDSFQSKLNMVLKIKRENDKRNNIIKRLYNTILGGGPTSKLFTNIREKNSLAYSCSSIYMEKDNLISIKSGIDSSNYDRAKELMINEIEEIKRGNFEEKELENAKLILLSELKEVKDYQIAILNSYIEDGIINESEEKELINSITKEEIISLANDSCLALIYFLKGDRP